MGMRRGSGRVEGRVGCLLPTAAAGASAAVKPTTPRTGAQLGRSCSAAVSAAAPTEPAQTTTPNWVSMTAATARSSAFASVLVRHNTVPVRARPEGGFSDGHKSPSHYFLVAMTAAHVNRQRACDDGVTVRPNTYSQAAATTSNRSAVRPRGRFALARCGRCRAAALEAAQEQLQLEYLPGARSGASPRHEGEVGPLASCCCGCRRPARDCTEIVCAYSPAPWPCLLAANGSGW